MLAQEVANLVIGENVYNQSAFTQFIEALNGKPLGFISDVSRAIPEPGSHSDIAPDGLQLAALAYLAKQAAKLIADEVLQVETSNQFQIAQKCRQVFYRPWTALFLENEVELRIEAARSKGAVYNVLALTMMGEDADELIAMHLAEAQ